jgi:hypothetical protein
MMKQENQIVNPVLHMLKRKAAKARTVISRGKITMISILIMLSFDKIYGNNMSKL